MTKEKDISAKKLESEDDVFADIFNSILFGGRQVIDPQKLRDEPTESFYVDDDGNMRNMFRDILKSYNNHQMTLVFLGLENETRVERPMPIRIMGYDYTNYKKQLDCYTETKKALMRLKHSATTDEEKDFVKREINNLGEFKLIPALTLVLNFDEKSWNQPKTLSGLSMDNSFSKYMQDYEITVVDVRRLSREKRKRFTSDFRFIANVMAENGIPDEDKTIALAHPVETLDMLIAYTNDNRYKAIRDNIIEKSKRKVVINMGSFLDEVERKAIVNSARVNLQLGAEQEFIVRFLMKALNITEQEAVDIFNNEVLKTA